ncbi:MalM family protein [Zooshikella sp. RANM57]|uniref:MalM family protein n=1 Tax=Zooshikella sp. RANM57 TaxID=3425863 RepID=UPI003D6F5A77
MYQNVYYRFIRYFSVIFILASVSTGYADIANWTGTWPRASTVSQQVANEGLVKSTVCCQHLADLPFQTIKPGQQHKVEINLDSPSYLFDTGKSFFAAYKLPEEANSLTITLYSIAGKTVFKPVVMLMDSQFRVTRLLRGNDFQYRPAKGFKGDSLDGQFRVDRSLPGNPLNETYMVLYTTASDRQGETTLLHPAKAYALARHNQPPAIPDPVAKHSAVGVLQLRIEQERKSFGERADYVPPAVVYPSTASTPASKPALPETQHYYQQAINQALAKEDMAKALRLVEEGERAGVQGIRTFFLERIRPKQ